jgi:ubiquinone/menaquinone biosynthesis C-methylase UbiE
LEIPTGQRLLEIGSGAGELWNRNLIAAASLSNVHISDLSPEMIYSARDSLSSRLPILTYTIADVRSLPYPEGSFDQVIADGVLDLVSEVDLALNQIDRILAHGGCLYASTGGKEHLKELGEMVNAVAGKARYGRSSDQFTFENGATVLGSRFPRVERLEYIDWLVFQEADPIREYARSESSMASALSGESLDRFSKLIEQLLTEQGEVRITIQKGLFRAWKG